MATEIKMPKFGETMTEGTINEWLKDKGAAVEKGEPIFEVTTDKSNLEVEAPAEGVLRKILVKTAETAEIGAVVGVIAAPGEELADYESKPAEKSTPEELETYDLCVVGGGPGGYVAAIKAAQLGAKTALIEEDTVGGTCLNRGCIPTKTYLKHANLLYELDRSKEFGIDVDGYSINWTKMKQRKDEVVDELTQGVAGLLKKNGVELIQGHGEVINETRVKVDGKEEAEIEAKNIIIATGSQPIMPNIDGIDLPGVITSKEALDLEELPESIVIIGGGVIGVEMATIFNSLGVEVVIVELMDQLVPNVDKKLAQLLTEELVSEGVKVSTEAEVTNIDSSALGLKVKVDTEEGLETITTDKVLAAVGRKPNLTGLENLDLELDEGAIAVDSKLQTNQSNVYAIGDAAAGDWLLAHVASAEGITAAKNALGAEQDMDYTVVPNCIYTIPELAAVGLTEDRARRQGYQVKVGTFSFRANGKALAAGHAKGLIKVVAEEKWDQVLGVQIIGPHATELIAEAALAVKLEATVEVLEETIHAHPTLSEAVMEAAHDVHDRTIHS